MAVLATATLASLAALTLVTGTPSPRHRPLDEPGRGSTLPATPATPATTRSPLAFPQLPAPAGPGVAASAAGRVVLRVHDVRGRRLTWSAFRALQSNGHGVGGYDDMLLDPSSLRVVRGWPLYAQGSDVALDRPATPTALGFSWPSSQGYSTVILDLPRPGTYLLSDLMATDAVRRTRAALVARPGYRSSARFRTTWRAAQLALTAAHRARAESDRARLAWSAYDAAVRADLLLLTEFGVQFAAGHRSLHPAWGFTTDSSEAAGAASAAAASIVRGSRRDGALRIVFDRERSPASYAAAVATAHRAGLHVVGQFLDSSAMAQISLAQWRSRVAAYVRGLPTVDVWEVGNEVNGDWLGRDVAAKVAFAAAYVKAHSRARTLVTLYWQLGQDTPQTSMFSWARRYLTTSVLGRIDEIGVSIYPEQAPMGFALDRVITTLHSAFPRQRISITELGYGSADLTHVWWWGSRTDPRGAARTAVADLYTRAVLGYRYSGGGTYWWYFPQEARPGSRLWTTFAAAYRAVAPR